MIDFTKVPSQQQPGQASMSGVPAYGQGQEQQQTYMGPVAPGTNLGGSAYGAYTQPQWSTAPPQTNAMQMPAQAMQGPAQGQMPQGQMPPQGQPQGQMPQQGLPQGQMPGFGQGPLVGGYGQDPNVLPPWMQGQNMMPPWMGGMPGMSPNFQVPNLFSMMGPQGPPQQGMPGMPNQYGPPLNQYPGGQW